MSAYIVSKNHIIYLVTAATSHGMSPPHSLNFHWYHKGGEGEPYKTLNYGDPERQAEVANMLWRENIKSVSARYPNESSATLPRPTHCDFVITAHDFCAVLWDRIDPVQVLKSCDCYEYQSCEHEDWKTSESYAFIDGLRHRAWHALKGYEEAEWGEPKTIREKQAEYRAKKRTEELTA